MVCGTLNYYVDQTSLIDMPLFNRSFFTSIHDLHRTLFIIPIIYAALVFRIRGSLSVSFAFLCVVIPRALLFSPYPNPLLRPVIFVIFSALIGLLLATQFNRIEKEKEVNTELSAAYEQLNEFDRRLKNNQEQLIQAEKLTSLGQLAASIAHEINNPLAGVLLCTRLLTKRLTANNISKEFVLDYLSKMETELIRSTGLVRNLLDFARQSPPDLKEINPNDIVSRVLELAAPMADVQNIQVIKELAPFLPKLMADFNQLQQVFTNLIMNAIQAMPEGGKLYLRTSVDDDQIKIEIRDTGCGISPENMRKLFTPFFTTKHEVKGVGLSLAVSYGIVQRHHGRIEAQSKEGEGTTFTIYLPVLDEVKN